MLNLNRYSQVTTLKWSISSFSQCMEACYGNLGGLLSRSWGNVQTSKHASRECMLGIDLDKTMPKYVSWSKPGKTRSLKTKKKIIDKENMWDEKTYLDNFITFHVFDSISFVIDCPKIFMQRTNKYGESVPLAKPLVGV